jgi:hypothetical protein
MAGPEQERMSAAARDVLLAEALGDLHRLQQSIQAVSAQLVAMKDQVNGLAQQEMVAVLDQKMNEFRHFQIPVVAAAKLQAHAEIFLRGVMGEIQRLVAQEVNAQVAKTRALALAGMLGVGFMVGFAVRSIF